MCETRFKARKPIQPAKLEILSERARQNYQSIYLDLYHEYR